MPQRHCVDVRTCFVLTVGRHPLQTTTLLDCRKPFVPMKQKQGGDLTPALFALLNYRSPLLAEPVASPAARTFFTLLRVSPSYSF